MAQIEMKFSEAEMLALYTLANVGAAAIMPGVKSKRERETLEQVRARVGYYAEAVYAWKAARKFQKAKGAK